MTRHCVVTNSVALCLGIFQFLGIYTLLKGLFRSELVLLIRCYVGVGSQICTLFKY